MIYTHIYRLNLVATIALLMKYLMLHFIVYHSVWRMLLMLIFLHTDKWLTRGLPPFEKNRRYLFAIVCNISTNRDRLDLKLWLSSMNCSSFTSLKHNKQTQEAGDARINSYSNLAFVNGTLHFYSDDEWLRGQQLQWITKKWISFPALMEMYFSQKLNKISYFIVLCCFWKKKIHPVIFSDCMKYYKAEHVIYRFLFRWKVSVSESWRKSRDNKNMLPLIHNATLHYPPWR